MVIHRMMLGRGVVPDGYARVIERSVGPEVWRPDSPGLASGGVVERIVDSGAERVIRRAWGFGDLGAERRVEPFAELAPKRTKPSRSGGGHSRPGPSAPLAERPSTPKPVPIPLEVFDPPDATALTALLTATLEDTAAAVRIPRLTDGRLAFMKTIARLVAPSKLPGYLARHEPEILAAVMTGRDDHDLELEVRPRTAFQFLMRYDVSVWAQPLATDRVRFEMLRETLQVERQVIETSCVLGGLCRLLMLPWQIPALAKDGLLMRRMYGAMLMYTRPRTGFERQAAYWREQFHCDGRSPAGTVDTRIKAFVAAGRSGLGVNPFE